MATNYYWMVSAMDTAPSEDGLTDVVKTVHWRRNASLEYNGKTYYGDIYGVMGCAAPDPLAFVPYDQLTFEDVCSWLNVNVDVPAMDAALDQQIANQINPPIVQLPLPWVPVPTTTTTTSTTTTELPSTTTTSTVFVEAE